MTSRLPREPLGIVRPKWPDGDRLGRGDAYPPNPAEKAPPLPQFSSGTLPLRGRPARADRGGGFRTRGRPYIFTQARPNEPAYDGPGLEIPQGTTYAKHAGHPAGAPTQKQPQRSRMWFQSIVHAGRARRLGGNPVYQVLSIKYLVTYSVQYARNPPLSSPGKGPQRFQELASKLCSK